MNATMSHPNPKEAGNALILVMILGTVIMAMAASLGEFSFSEDREIEDNLLETRVYFAIKGVITYLETSAIVAAPSDMETDLGTYLDALDGIYDDTFPNAADGNDDFEIVGENPGGGVSPRVTFYYREFESSNASNRYAFSIEFYREPTATNQTDDKNRIQANVVAPTLGAGESLAPIVSGVENRIIDTAVYFNSFYVSEIKHVP